MREASVPCAAASGKEGHYNRRSFPFAHGSMVIARLLVLLAAAFGGGDPSAPAPAALSVERPWIRLAPPGARVMAGYGLISNRGGETLVLVGAESEAFGAIEIHESFERDGVMRMRRIPELPIPPGGTVALKPGGLHLMLFRPAGELTEGAEVPIRLRLADGRTVKVRFAVRAGPPDDQGSRASERSAR